MRLILYAMGQIFERYKDRLNWNNIEAVCDKKIEENKFTYGEYEVPAILPNILFDFEYDFVVVFSNKYFEEIKQELVGEYSVSKDKIISWREIIEEERNVLSDFLVFCRKNFRERRYRKYLDVGMAYLHKKYLTKAELQLGEQIILDGILSEDAELNINLYDKVYESCKEIRDFYDVAILWKIPQRWEDILEVVSKHTKCIVFWMRRDVELNLKKRLEQFGNVKCISTSDGDFWIVDTERKCLPNDVSIYVVTHRKYNVNKDVPYIPLCVGNYQEEGYLTEQTGENIAYLNKRINECTALYWIWKNTNSKYVGLNHYRRYFYNNEIVSMDNYLDIEHMNEIFKEYDIILPQTRPYDNMTMLEQIRESMNPELCEKGYSIIRRKIERNQPYYVDAFDSVMNGHVIFNCNIFVTKREILNQYCEWLFSFLIEAAEEIDVEGYDSYSQRVIGFFAERMWTVWLRKNRLRIKELPYVTIR
ncbi:MAG: DUF4422 domain-containing protein [Dorea sp.]|nr:DUF4422 domain-containing protein [Dorea sp.]